MMLPLALKLLLSVCIALSVSRATCDTVPAFLWSSEAIFNEGGFAESARTDREVRSLSFTTILDKWTVCCSEEGGDLVLKLLLLQTTDASALVKAITTGQRGVLSRGDFAQRIANIDRLVVVLIEGQVCLFTGLGPFISARQFVEFGVSIVQEISPEALLIVLNTKALFIVLTIALSDWMCDRPAGSGSSRCATI